MSEGCSRVSEEQSGAPLGPFRFASTGRSTVGSLSKWLIRRDSFLITQCSDQISLLNAHPQSPICPLNLKLNPSNPSSKNQTRIRSRRKDQSQQRHLRVRVREQVGLNPLRIRQQQKERLRTLEQEELIACQILRSRRPNHVTPTTHRLTAANPPAAQPSTIHHRR